MSRATGTGRRAARAAHARAGGARAGLPADDARRNRGRGHVPGPRDAARARHRGPAGPARARVHPGADRRLPLEGRDQAGARRTVRRGGPRAAGRRGRRRSRRRPRVRGAGARNPARGRRNRLRGAALARRWAADAGGLRRRPPRTARASTTTWNATTCDRPGHRRHHCGRGLRGRFHLVRLALRAAARARLSVDDLGRLVRRHPGGPRARSGARSGAALLPGVHGDVRGARHDRDRSRPDAPGQPSAAAADLQAW